jgi:hypothetical protein
VQTLGGTCAMEMSQLVLVIGWTYYTHLLDSFGGDCRRLLHRDSRVVNAVQSGSLAHDLPHSLSDGAIA